MFNLNYNLNSVVHFILKVVQINKCLLINLLLAFLSITISYWLISCNHNNFALSNTIVFLLIFLSVYNWMKIDNIQFTDMSLYNLCKLSLCALFSNLIYLPLLLLMDSSLFKLMIINFFVLTFFILISKICASIYSELYK